jgi:hypothetical protein
MELRVFTVKESQAPPTVPSAPREKFPRHLKENTSTDKAWTSSVNVQCIRRCAISVDLLKFEASATSNGILVR